MNIEDRLKQDAARFRAVTPPDNLRSLLQASLENVPAPAQPRPASGLMRWFRPAAALVSLMFIVVLVTAVYPLQLPGQPGPGDFDILGVPAAAPAVDLIPWLSIPGLLGLGFLVQAVRREKVQVRVALAAIFIITLLAVILLLYNLVPALRFDINAHLRPVEKNQPVLMTVAQAWPELPPKTALVYQGDNLSAYWSITPLDEARDHLENQLSEAKVRNLSPARSRIAGRLGASRYDITLEQFNSRTLIKIVSSSNTR